MFERLSIPTPFQVGPVNAYLAGRTIVDPGPDSQQSWAALCEELEARGLGPGDLTRVLVTHPHPDHFGLAKRLRAEGATVVASPEAADVIADFEGRLEYEQDFFVPFMIRHGVSEETARTVAQLPQAYLEYAPAVETDREVDDGDAIDLGADESGGNDGNGDDPDDDGRGIGVLSAAGHATGELVFTFPDGNGRSAIVGDQVLPDITPNPLLQPPIEEGGQRPRVLPAFNDSLSRLQKRGFRRILPGHREVVTAPDARIDEILAAHEKRTENVADLVAGPTTAAEVMEGLFGDLPATEVFPGLSEAVGHLDVLEARGRVQCEQRGGMTIYEPV